MKETFIASTLLMMCSLTVLAQPETPADYVDMFVGTSNSRAMLGPYATVPYSLVQVGPDNQEHGWMGGYEYSIMNITGFSHIHAWAMAGLMVMPATANFTNKLGMVAYPYRGAGAGFHSRFMRETEKAEPGYYSAFLYDAGCKAEIAASTRCAFHQYTFDNDYSDARMMLRLLFPAEYDYKILPGSRITKISPTRIEGIANTVAICAGEYKLHFVIDFEKPFKRFNGSVENDIQHDIQTIEGEGDLGGYVEFDVRKGEAVKMKVGLSLVDMHGARNNLETEMSGFAWNFDKARSSAKAQWNTILDKIEIETKDEALKQKFYTNFYRSLSKNTYNDVDGRYTDPNENIQQAPDGADIYGGDAFWNAHWSYNPLLAFVAPRLLNNWVQTELELFKHTGWTNNGPTGMEHTGIMEVTHEIALIVGAYQKGIRDYDVSMLYDAVRHNSMEQGRYLPNTGLAGMQHLDLYDKYGYVPCDRGRSSQTLDYAYTDFCAAQLALVTGHKEDYKFFLKRSGNWKNQFHPTLKWQVPKDSNGEWSEDYDPCRGKYWVEGNGWQYTWYVPHDVKGLIELMGRDLFNERLEAGYKHGRRFNYAAHAFDRYQEEIFEYYVNQGNECAMQTAYLFNYSGKPWLTQKYTRDILNVFYGSTPYSGWEGDEDEGHMSSWYVMTSIGFFEMDGGVTPTPMIDITSPAFDKVTIKLDPKYHTGKEFVIEALNNSPENVYIQSATLNGKPLKTTRIKYTDVTAGGRLVYIMGNTPNKTWGNSGV